MMVAVTGGSGVVGRAVVRHLVAAGHEVLALARTAEASSILDGLGAGVVSGDVLDETAVERLAKGSNWLFHIAGVNEMCSRDPSRMWRVNVEGTMNVIAASARGGVDRLIHTSSAVTIGEEHGTIGTEGSRHRGFFLSEYERSKTVAERLAFDTLQDIEVVSVNPASVQGPGRSSGTGALLLAAARGNVPLLVDTVISVVDIDDCARGHLLAAETGQPGQRYLLSGAVLTVREAVAMMNHYLARTTRPWFIRPEVVTALAPAVDAAFRIIGRQSPLCAESARVLLRGHRYDGARATRDLGLDYTPVGDTMQKALEWFASEGLIE